MRSIKFSLSRKSVSGWDAAVLLLESYLKGQQKADQLLDQLPEDFSGERRANCQALFLGSLRQGHRVRSALKALMRKKAKAQVEAVLLVTGYEILSEDAERIPKIIHHAVERSKKRINRFEQGFLNAVLRKLPSALNEIDASKSPAAFYSHPQWLVSRWEKEFGPAASRELLTWDQKIPATYLKMYQAPETTPKGLEPSQWDCFYKVTREASWRDDLHPLLDKGNAYIKDPSTRLAPEILAPRAGESVLDLCAAPGGKAYDIAHAMNRTGLIVAVDLPGNRIGRLQQNLDSLKTESLRCEIVESDLLELTEETFSNKDLPTSFDAVMLDAPCSNTGVIQRRTDVKWRLEPKDISSCAKLQLELLKASSKFVKAGGRIVYSTCSIESAENEAVVDAFLASEAGRRFTLAQKITSLPWETGHDGAGAFRLERA